ncbi:MAG TPA: trehalose-6-phosphate synthase [Candidatus Limnocylindrales bacterium]
MTDSRSAHERGASRLGPYLDTLLPADQRLVVASNRGPLTFDRKRDGAWQAQRGSGGLVTALAELGRLAPITWVSAAMDQPDRDAAQLLAGEDGAQRQELLARVDQQLPGQDLRLVMRDIPADAWRSHYGVVANPFLWFMQHQLYTLPYEPNIDDSLVHAWQTGYRTVNRAFADSILEQTAADRRPVVMLQDYHLYLAGRYIRERRPESLLLHFNHIPWPSVDSWLVLPQTLRRTICEGLLANDICGLQTDRYARNFLDTVEAFVRDARVDPAGRHVRWRGRTIWVRAYPISIDPDSLTDFARGPEVARRRQELSDRLERADKPKLIVRVDRLEPSKNVLRGFLAFEALLKRRPELRKRVRFLAIQSISRESVPEYARYAAAVREVVARINGLTDPDQAPIWLLDGQDYALAIAALSLADVTLVNPVVDGMNLVAKEAVVVGRGAIVLSETAGAAEQLGADALMVAAADVAGTSEMLERALDMPADERAQRLRRLRASVRNEDLAWWLARQLRDLSAVAKGGRPPSRALRDMVRTFEPALRD